MNQGLFSFLKGVEPFKQVLDAVNKGEITALFGMQEGFKAYLASAVKYHSDKPILFVLQNDVQAQKTSEDIGQLLGGQCVFLPAREIRFAKGAASLENAWRRLEALDDMMTGNAKVLCTSMEALMNPMVPLDLFKRACFSLAPGDRYEPTDLIEDLVHMGYERVEMVEGKGQCALRGAIVDVYVPARQNAYRFEFFDDEVDSIRTFDCISQRTLEKCKTAAISPANEVVLDEMDLDQAAKRMQALFGTVEKVEPKRLIFEELPPLPEDDDELPSLFDKPLKKEESPQRTQVQVFMNSQEADLVAKGIPFKRIANYIHIVCENCVSVLNWMPDSIFILDKPDQLREAAQSRMDSFQEEIKAALERGEASKEQLGLLYHYDEIVRGIAHQPILTLSEFLRGLGGLTPKNVIEFDAKGVAPYQARLKDLASDMHHWRSEGFCAILAAGGVARGKRLCQSLYELEAAATFTEELQGNPIIGETLALPITLTKGFIWPQAKLALIGDSDIFGTGYKKARSRRNTGERIAAFTDLNVGDYVVHENHGVGIYQGTVRLQTEGTYRDYLFIQYMGNDKLYVPTEQLDRVQRFIGAQNTPPKLNKLGGGEWQKQKSKVKAGLKAIAFDLVKLYAERANKPGYAFSKDTPWQRQFEDLFPYELTIDQQQSVRDIERDMETPTNMDRLLCGDVGYGKTEVALRAAFKAVMDSKQVAILAPTTILAQQHFNTLKKRFESFPVSVAMVSRFLTPKEQKEALADVMLGQVDILVGTHRLLNKDVKFKDLGLLIIDEEQRFGVAHKEMIKNIKNNVDVLTLSATPIPRTLHMSMVGIRDMSLLETPPEERMPVQTYVMEYSDGVIRDAILREIGRGGQVYFLYNRVHSIDQFHNRLKALVPEARIAVAHGQMREHALEDVMMDFYEGAFDVLLCTTIIESGLDVPLANTLIVFDGDRFGLSQLYQLRGRVGRSNRQAYAYFTVRPDKMLSETAQKRLTAIREFTEFGAGFRIAMRDLEIRGSGNILGPEQHGHLSTVGYDMYCKLIEETLREARGEKGIPSELDTRVELKIDAFLPSDYVRDERQRMEMYKRIASIKNREDREDIEEELLDRFGEAPELVDKLLDIAHIRALAAQLGMAQVTYRNGTLFMRFDENYAPDPLKLLNAILKTDPRLTLSATKPPSLLLKDPKKTQEELLKEAIKLLEKLLEEVFAQDVLPEN